jgi:hypothetical protein
MNQYIKITILEIYNIERICQIVTLTFLSTGFNMADAAIVITDKFYVNYSIRNEGSYEKDKYVSSKVRLGFATYMEENIAFQKRKGTIDRWAGSEDTADTVANTPRSGYTFGRSVTHGGNWRNTTVNWRIVDPLGFELEINSGNMAQLLQLCTIDKGVILDECVWGWDKGNSSKVVLVPVNSDLYKEARKTTVRHFAETIDVKDATLGDMVEYQNGQMGIYFGKVKVMSIESGSYYSGCEYGKVSFDNQHVLLVDNDTLHFMTTPKLVKCTRGSKTYTEQEAEVFINDLYSKPDRKVASASYSGPSRRGKYLTYAKKPSTALTLTEVSKDVVVSGLRHDYQKGQMIYSHSFKMRDGNYVLEDKDGSRYLVYGIEHELLGSGRRHQATEEFFDGLSDDVDLKVKLIANKDYEGKNTGLIGDRVRALPLKNFVKFYTIAIQYGDKTVKIE